jgi:hypothetical protein
MQAFLEKYEALTERMRHVEKGQGGYASRRQAATRGLETAGRDAVCAVSLVEGRERDWSGKEVAFGSSTEGHKDHISKRKTQNIKTAPHTVGGHKSKRSLKIIIPSP